MWTEYLPGSSTWEMGSRIIYLLSPLLLVWGLSPGLLSPHFCAAPYCRLKGLPRNQTKPWGRKWNDLEVGQYQSQSQMRSWHGTLQLEMSWGVGVTQGSRICTPKTVYFTRVAPKDHAQKWPVGSSLLCSVSQEAIWMAGEQREGGRRGRAFFSSRFLLAVLLSGGWVPPLKTACL